MEKIKIALMSYAVDNRPNKGTAVYARKIIEHLLNDDRFDCYLIHYEKVDDPLYKNAKEIIMPRIKIPRGTHFISWMMFFWKYRKEKFDIIHWFQPRLYPFYWLAPARKIVVTAHAAGQYTAAVRRFLSNEIFKFVLTYLNRWLSAVIADSEYAKREIRKYYRIKKENIFVTYLGGGEVYKIIDKNHALNQIKDKYEISESYILDVSRLQHHKNVESLVRAYILMRNKYKERKEKLVNIGGPLFTHREVYAIANNSSYKDDIYFVDFVEQEDLNAFYSAADLFVFPSLNEGFGLPVIESMASGTAVITSNITALPEVAGDATILVDPLNIEQIAEEMNRVLSNDNLKNDLIKKGLERAKEFTWDKTAEKTKEIYFDLLKN